MSTKQKRVAASDDAEALSIQNAMKFGRPVYFLMHANGSTIDVGVDKANFLKERDAYVSNTPDGRFNIRLFERIHTQMRPI